MSEPAAALVAPVRCLECYAEVTERTLKSGPVWCSSGPGPHTLCERSPDFHHHPDLGPDSGHTFRVSVESRGSYAVTGVEGHTDADEFMGPVMTVEVRAWNLPEALRRVSGYPLAVWFPTEDDEPAKTRTVSPLPSTPLTVSDAEIYGPGEGS